MQNFKPHCEHGDVALVFSNLQNKTTDNNVHEVKDALEIPLIHQETYLACRYVKISLGSLKIVIKSEPQATEPKW